MKICGSCGCVLAELDSVCGQCGASVDAPAPAAEEPVPGEAWPEPEPATPEPEPAQPEPEPEPVFDAEPEDEGRKGKWAILIASTLIGCSALGLGAYYLVHQDGRGPIRIALGEIGSDGTVSGTESAEPTPTESESDASETPSESATPTEEPSPSIDLLGTPGQADGLIAAGSWTFTTVLFNVTKVDMSDNSFRLDRAGIGMSESNTQCVTPGLAANPRASVFPLRASMDCRASNFSMAAGRYSASMSCNFPQYGGRRPVEVSGRYGDNDITVEARVRVPAQVVSGDFERAPEIYLHYRINGRRTRPCS